MPSTDRIVTNTITSQISWSTNHNVSRDIWVMASACAAHLSLRVDADQTVEFQHIALRRGAAASPRDCSRQKKQLPRGSEYLGGVPARATEVTEERLNRRE